MILDFFNENLLMGLIVSLTTTISAFLFKQGLDWISKQTLPNTAKKESTSKLAIRLLGLFCWVIVGLGLISSLILIIEYLQVHLFN